MTNRLILWIKRTKALYQVTAIIFILAGLAYVVFPPRTTTQFFDATWPPLLWGGCMVLGGTLDLWGIRSKVYDWSILGLAFLWVGTGSLALAQTMVMIAPPPTLTRGGGTALYWVLMFFVIAKLVIVAADKRDGKYAQTQVTEEQ